MHLFILNLIEGYSIQIFLNFDSGNYNLTIFLLLLLTAVRIRTIMKNRKILWNILKFPNCSVCRTTCWMYWCADEICIGIWFYMPKYWLMTTNDIAKIITTTSSLVIQNNTYTKLHANDIPNNKYFNKFFQFRDITFSAACRHPLWSRWQ